MFYDNKKVKIFFGKLMISDTVKYLVNNSDDFRNFIHSMLLLYENCSFTDMSLEDIEFMEQEIKQCIEQGRYYMGNKNENAIYVYPRFSFYGRYQMTGRVRNIVESCGMEADAIWIQTDCRSDGRIFTTVCFAFER